MLLNKVVEQMVVSNERGDKDRFRELFGFQVRTSSAFCKQWVEAGFLQVVDPSRKGRKYRLAPKYVEHE